MNPVFCLGDILSDFRHLFNQQNFALFQAFIFGFIANSGRGTLDGPLSMEWFRDEVLVVSEVSFPGGNGMPMPSPPFSSDVSNTFLEIGFTSMMKLRH